MTGRPAAVMPKGMTARYAVRRAYPVRSGDVVLSHASADEAGLIACLGLEALGATVISIVGSGEKAEVAWAHGWGNVIISTKEDVTERVREITGARDASARRRKPAPGSSVPDRFGSRPTVSRSRSEWDRPGTGAAAGPERRSGGPA